MCSCVSIDAAPKPNVLLILADDLGWSDLGCYGSEIRTPNLDALANNGLRFTQFYNSARCSPSRASILTGLHPHQAGFPNLSGVLPKNCVTIPEVLKAAGYRTFMVGKWHLSHESKPTDRGFDEFYGMLGGYNSCWQEDPFYTRHPAGHEKRIYAPGAFYSTDVFGDYVVDFMGGNSKAARPWFCYLAFNAPHFPLHAPESDIAKYEPVYAQGWDKIRAQRLARQKDLGLIGKDVALTPRSVIPANRFNRQTGWADKDNPAWDTLPADRQTDLARRMAVFAAMVDRLDQNVGRVVQHLKKTGEFENTLIFFLSDNGACAEWDPYGFDGSSGPNNVLHRGEDVKKMGTPESYISYGSGWANTGNTPWRLYKHYGHEGGINTPLIVHWPAGLKTKPGDLCRQPGHIADFMPTVAELAGATYPKEREGRNILPMEGVSLTPTFRGESLAARTIFVEHEGNRTVREGDWKLVALEGAPWELYNMAQDPTEMNNLAAKESARVQRMGAAWEAWAERCMVKKNNPPAEKKGKKAAANAGGVTPSPEIANRPLVITCEVVPQAREGVILAHGGRQNGYSLHLQNGRLVFSVKIEEKLFAITAPEVPPGRFAVEARLQPDGKMTLTINGQGVAAGKASGLIPVQPVDGLSIGQDERTAVGDYTAPNPLKGTVDKVKLLTK
jgi:arylsulfatase